LSTRSCAGAAAALFLCLAPAGHARAQTITATLNSPPNVYSGQPASLSIGVQYTNSDPTHPALHEVTFTVPAAYTITGVTGPSGLWTSTIAGRVATFDTACTDPGIAPGGAATFIIAVTAAARANDTNDTVPVAGYSRASGTWCSGTHVSNIRSTVTVPLKVLLVTASTSPPNLLGPGLKSTLTWTVRNWSSSNKTVALTLNPAGTSGSGWSGSCGAFSGNPVRSGGTGTMTCTYTFSASGTYTFRATATGGTSTSLPASISIGVGTATASWNHAAVVLGRASTLTVTNTSQATIVRVDVKNALTGGLQIDSASGTNGLSYSAGSSSASDAVFTGSLLPGASSTLTITYHLASGATTTSTAFTLTLTPTDGSGYAVSVSVPSMPLVVPLPDVYGLGILSSSSGQQLDWTNVSGNGSTHNGVVIFRTPAATTPPTPVDFKQYVVGTDADVILADAGTAVGVQSYLDPTTGSNNYRVCNHDTYFVYSNCNSGFWNQGGWLDSAVPPTGGWTRQLGINALQLIGIFPGGNAAAPNNQPLVTVLNRANGQRIAAPIALTGIPAVNTAGTKLANGHDFAFAADGSGTVTAFDATTGASTWSVNESGEAFTAGIDGITWSAASPAFQSAYPADALLLGSSTTGNLIALNAETGAPFWTIAMGSNSFALAYYDAGTNSIFVPTSAGVFAYNLSTSRPGTPPAVVSGWANPGGAYTVGCVRTTSASYIGCVDRSGILRVIDKATGRVQAQIPTGVSSPSPSSLSRMSAGTPGFVVGSASTIVRVAANATFTTLSVVGQWTPPGITLSPILGFSPSGYVITAGSDLRLHKLSSETVQQIGQSNPITARLSQPLVGAPSWDSTNNLFLLGTNEGRIWAVPAF